MKIIVTGHEPKYADLDYEWREASKWEYEARSWEVTPYGCLEILGEDGHIVATFAAMAWAHVHGCAEDK